MSVRSTSRCSTSPSPTGSASRRGLCVHTETCGLALALEHTGDLYRATTSSSRATSSATSASRTWSTSSRPAATTIGLDKRDTLPNYRLECDVRFACHGGYPKTASARPRTASPASTTSARLQGLLPPRRHADANHGHAARPEPRPLLGDRAGIRSRQRRRGRNDRAPAAQAANGRTAMGCRCRPSARPRTRATTGQPMRLNDQSGVL